MKVVGFGSLEGIFHLVTAKAWVDNCRKLEYYRKRKKQFYMQTWHGGLGIKKIEGDCLNISERYVKAAQNDSNMIDVILSNSDHLSNIFKKSFWYDGPILQNGMPKNDCIVNIDKKRSEQIKEKLSLSLEYKICIYAPTFRNSSDLNLFTIKAKVIKEALEERFNGKWKILVRYHPNTASRIDTKQINHDLMDVTNYSDTQELLMISDCLITDYSSIIFDFIIMKKPAFIFAKDYQEYINQERGVYYKLSELPFSIATTNAELGRIIRTFDDDDYRKNIESFMKKTNCVETGISAKLATKYLIEKINS